MKKILSALLVFVSIVLFFVFDFHFFGRLSQHSWVDYLGIVFAYCLFAMGIRFLFMSKFSWKYSACIMGSFALCLVIVLSLFRLQMPERGSIAYYQSPFGNCSEWLGPIFKTELGQKMAKSTLQTIKPSLAYTISVSEEVCRLEIIKAAIQKSPLPKFCSELNSDDPVSCLLAFNDKIHSTNPYSITGLILNSATSVTSVMRAKKAEKLLVGRKLTSCEDIKHTANMLEIVAQGSRLLDTRATPKNLGYSVETNKAIIDQALISKMINQLKSHGNPGSLIRNFLFEMPNRQTEVAALIALDVEMASNAQEKMQAIADKILLESEKDIQSCNGLRKPSSVRDPNLQRQLERIKDVKEYFERLKFARSEQH